MLINCCSLIRVPVLRDHRIVHWLKGNHVDEMVGYLSRLVVSRVCGGKQNPQVRNLLIESSLNVLVALRRFDLAELVAFKLA